MMKKRKMKVMCVQETKRRGEMARKMAEGYKMLHRRCTEKQKPRTVDGRGGDGSWGDAGSMEDDIRH